MFNLPPKTFFSSIKKNLLTLFSTASTYQTQQQLASALHATLRFSKQLSSPRLHEQDVIVALSVSAWFLGTEPILFCFVLFLIAVESVLKWFTSNFKCSA